MATAPSTTPRQTHGPAPPRLSPPAPRPRPPPPRRVTPSCASRSSTSRSPGTLRRCLRRRAWTRPSWRSSRPRPRPQRRRKRRHCDSARSSSCEAQGCAQPAATAKAAHEGDRPDRATLWRFPFLCSRASAFGAYGRATAARTRAIPWASCCCSCRYYVVTTSMPLCWPLLL